MNNQDKTLKKYEEIPLKNSANDSANIEKYFLKKQVGYNYKKSGTKRVLINKSDDIDIAVGDYLYLITPMQFEELNAASVEDKTKIKQLQIELNNAVDISNKKLKGNIEEITKKHEDKIKEIKEQHQEELQQQELQHNKKVEEIKEQYLVELDNKIEQHNKEVEELKKELADQQTIIDKLQQQELQHNKDIKEYQQSYQQSLTKRESLLKEYQELKDKEYNYITLYNNLINDIKNISWFDAIRNKHKALLKEHHQVKMPLNNTTLEIKQDNKHNQD